MSTLPVVFIALCAAMAGLGLGEFRYQSLKKRIMEARRLRELKQELKNDER